MLSFYIIHSAWKDIEVVMDVGWPFVFNNFFVSAVATNTLVATNSIVATTKTGITCIIILMCCSTDVAGTLWHDFNLHTVLLHPTLDLEHETQLGWTWSGSPGSLKASSSFRRGCEAHWVFWLMSGESEMSRSWGTKRVKTAPAVAECKPRPTNCDLIVNCIEFGAPGVKLRKPDTSSKHIALK